MNSKSKEKIKPEIEIQAGNAVQVKHFISAVITLVHVCVRNDLDQTKTAGFSVPNGHWHQAKLTPWTNTYTFSDLLMFIFSLFDWSDDADF